ncbi:hypothetical protein AYO44_05265 [Planctomycetaceae bacterium SCGC AG-212-F19]|nr:hypothetical protein AYO44_05265 [Planctomycetaceae bacterium SCGC AG-212-F19]
MKGSVRPRVSIGMPVFNEEDYVADALDSLLGQSFGDFELIVSDNGSTDRTRQICEEYARKDRRIRYFRQQRNRGATYNFNFVFEESKADYFMWAACDDRWSSDCLNEYVESLESHPSAALVFCHFRVYNFVTRELTDVPVTPSCHDSPVKNYLTRLRNATPSMVYGLFRKKHFRQMVGRVENFDFWDVYFTHAMATSGNLLVIPRPLYTAGIRSKVRIPRSVTGGRLVYRNFYTRNIQLIMSHFSLLQAAWVIPYFTRWHWHLVRNTEAAIRRLQGNAA